MSRCKLCSVRSVVRVLIDWLKLTKNIGSVIFAMNSHITINPIILISFSFIILQIDLCIDW